MEIWKLSLLDKFLGKLPGEKVNIIFMHFLQVKPEGVDGEKGNLLNCIHPNQVEVLSKNLADGRVRGIWEHENNVWPAPAIFLTTGA